MANRYQDKELIESVGIELEFSNVDRDSHIFKNHLMKNLPSYKDVHDASCESPIITLGNYPITIDDREDFIKIKNLCKKTIVGGEIISPIVYSSSPEWIKQVYSLCRILKDFGETEDSSRDSFHVHINVTRDIPLYALKNLLRLEGNLEAILFRLGGLGKINRGIENNFCYERPFLGHGPPVVVVKRNAYPICVFDDMMKAKTKVDFLTRFGDSYFWGNGGKKQKYIAVRYMALNFYPISYQGSFEFRTANKTLNPEYLLAWTNFCKAFVQKAFFSKTEESFEKIQRPLYENREISLGEFRNAISYLDSLDNDTIEILEDIWEISPTPTFDNKWRYTHLNNANGFNSGDYLPEAIPPNYEILKPTFVDVHRLNRDVVFGERLRNVDPPVLRHDRFNDDDNGKIVRFFDEQDHDTTFVNMRINDFKRYNENGMWWTCDEYFYSGYSFSISFRRKNGIFTLEIDEKRHDEKRVKNFDENNFDIRRFSIEIELDSFIFDVLDDLFEIGEE